MLSDRPPTIRPACPAPGQPAGPDFDLFRLVSFPSQQFRIGYTYEDRPAGQTFAVVQVCDSGGQWVDFARDTLARVLELARDVRPVRSGESPTPVAGPPCLFCGGRTEPAGAVGVDGGRLFQCVECGRYRYSPAAGPRREGA